MCVYIYITIETLYMPQTIYLSFAFLYNKYSLSNSTPTSFIIPF